MEPEKNKKDSKEFKSRYASLDNEYHSLTGAADYNFKKGNLKKALIQYTKAIKIANKIIENYATKEEIDDWKEEVRDISKMCHDLCLEIETPGVCKLADIIKNHLEAENYKELTKLKSQNEYFNIAFNIVSNYLKNNNTK